MRDDYNYRNLILWQKAQELTLQILKPVAALPRSNVNDVPVRQSIRSSSSIAANIAEGHGRFAPRGHAYHLQIAKRSACETDSWLALLRRSGAITSEREAPLHDVCMELIAMLTSKIRDLERIQYRVGEERRAYDGAHAVDVDEFVPEDRFLVLGSRSEVTMSSDMTKYLLSESDMPTHWYNITADLPSPPPPPLHPGTHQPIGPADLAPLFPMELIKQEVSQKRFIEIPDEVREVYRLWRPTPLVRARRLERALDTPAHIYFKYEGASPVGSHKPNTAVAQAYYNKQEGVKRLTTETGAGQWGTALAMACNFFGMELKIYMVKVSFEQKPYRRSMMQLYGADVVPSPSPDTQAGRAFLAASPDNPGSLGMAISEAVEDAAKRDDTKYSLGSVLNHVLMHQTVIGQEALKQMEMAGEYPDIVIGCAGGGSNFAGMAFPFMREKLAAARQTKFIAAEPEACPSLTKGEYRYDFGDTAGMTPLVKMYTLGHTFIPEGIHAGGLRYHGMANLICELYDQGFIEARAYHQNAVFEAALQFARTEAIVPAPEAAHAIRCAIDEALACKQAGQSKTILFNLSGHGYFDMSAYDNYLAGKLQDFAYPEARVRDAMKEVPVVAAS